ncbi:lipase family alpha/beta hydrolase [Arenicella xantha]|uniref:Thioesterase superfamily protein n=1 Tax=Arenicella xantha TaxID=644221 RepID=A0A395JMD0_9GAMM|nr:thioesterase domain-containing protein [Arenicella xantha]RBP51769.1 thioesterase superfamily protein [Arenicella xantha]
MVRKPPSKLSFVLESRALLDVALVPFSLLRSKLKVREPAVNGALPIMMFPGFGSDEIYLRALELHLRRLGYCTEGWGLGVNLAGTNYPHVLEDLAPYWEFDLPNNYSADTYKGEGGVPYLCDLAIARVKQRSTELDSPVVLIGWSLGGYIARECARELTDQVAQVITFGAPIVGGPKYSRAADFFKAKNYDLDWIEQSIDKRNRKPILQPITSIFSRTDGVVSATAAVDEMSPNVQNIEVNSAHLGMGFNRKIWKIVTHALREQAEQRHRISGKC